MSNEVDLNTPETTVEVPDENEEILIKDDSERVIDELTSIEREIAIMHDVIEIDSQDDDKTKQEDNLVLVESHDIHLSEIQNDSVENQLLENNASKNSDRRNGTSTVAEVSDAPDSTGSPTPNRETQQSVHEDLIALLKGSDSDDENVEAGVRIEGEGEFEVVDIIDADHDLVPEADPLSKETAKEPLTKEQEHKLALEQFQSLGRQKNTAKSRRRKQDIKPITQTADLLTSLVSDWSDGDDANADSEEGVPPPKKKIAVSGPNAKSTQASKASAQVKGSQVLKTAQPPKGSQPKSVQVQKPVNTALTKDQEKSVPASNPPKKIINTAATPASQSKKLINSTQSQEKKAPAIPPPSPFKRTRIIKRKIIWDPDAPETQFSYAKLVKPSTPTPIKKDTKKDRSTPTLKNKDGPNSRPTTPAASTPTTRATSETPSTGKKKKFSEIDRLLGDEGAVNMLNSLEADRTKRTSENETRGRKSASLSISPQERASTPQKKEPAPQKRRIIKPKASTSWDYVYKKQQQNEDSMIIRRRSNSSYSSNASLNRLSVDGPSSAGKTPKNLPKSSTKVSVKTPESDQQFEFAKPENKNKLKKNKSPTNIVNPLPADMKKAAPKRTLKSPVNDDINDTDEILDVKVLKIGSVRQVTFNTHRSKLGNTFTVHLMNQLVEILDDLSDDKDCNAVLMLSDGPNFCQGIDFTDMALGTLEKRKNAANQMAKAVKNFLTTLAKFKKPLIAGVNGANSGLGVTMLPLFDVVIGSDKGTYETPYAKIGQIPEGYYIFSETQKIRSAFKTKLLWLAEKLHSTESALSGLVNKLTSVNKVDEEALAAAKRIASFSPETYSVMKKRSIDEVLPQILVSLDDEEEILVKQWCSAPCVENFKHFIHKGQW